MLLAWHPGPLYTSHEALLLDYKRCLLAGDPADQESLYGGSAHFLWIGERTRQLDGAHIAFAGLLANPIGVKIGSEVTPGRVVDYCEQLNPHGRPGRLTLISRMKSRVQPVRYWRAGLAGAGSRQRAARGARDVELEVPVDVQFHPDLRVSCKGSRHA